MKEAVEILRAHRAKVAGTDPNHVDLPFIDKMISLGEVSTVRSPEQKREIQRFTDRAKEVLASDGAIIYESTGETITSQTESQKAKGKPSFWYVTSGGERLVGRTSRLSEVAIYPDPERFFVPNTGNKSIDEQEKLVKKDAQELSRRLGLNEITQVIPDEASTFSEVVFKHFDETGEWLFDEKYARAHDLDFIYGRTKNPVNESGSDVADVGNANPDRGLNVGDWNRGNGLRGVWVVRLVVPNRK